MILGPFWMNKYNLASLKIVYDKPGTLVVSGALRSRKQDTQLLDRLVEKKGVISAEINYSTKMLEVVYDVNKVTSTTVYNYVENLVELALGLMLLA
ncbi:MAG: hypothetical protein ATN35_02620 [Epulopiscium sp. Nele67-Bin004]|nr:MAG: hypothetical protein ATN35_02620 [Epulopiscium sp. Nele67-Bin004]